MTGPLLIAIGLLSMAFLATFLHSNHSNNELSEQVSRRKVLRELKRIEDRHPERIIE